MSLRKPGSPAAAGNVHRHRLQRGGCVYSHCGAEPVVIVRVLNGDADHMGETLNRLCPLHYRSVLDAWLGELRRGGPVLRLVVVPADRLDLCHGEHGAARGLAL